MSTDYVFDGDKRVPYLESDPVGPRSGYGRSKLVGERAVAGSAPERHTIVRSSWLFGSAGAAFPQTMLTLAGERDRLTVVDDQVGCPTFTGHLAEALVELAARGPQAPRGILHVAGAGQCSWFEFAREIVAAGGAHGLRGGPGQHRGVSPSRATPGVQRPAQRARGAGAASTGVRGCASTGAARGRSHVMKLLVCGAAGFIGSTFARAAGA